MTNIIEKNTEYSIKMPDGKIQKFAYYGEKENGRLILMNTRYGTLTSMSALYFAKLIKKYPCKTRPYNVEGIFEEEATAPMKMPKETVVVDTLQASLNKTEEKRKIQEERQRKLYLKWAFRLKSLPIDVEIKLRDSVKIEPRILGENIEKWVSGNYNGSILELLAKFGEVKNLLQGTEWFVK